MNKPPGLAIIVTYSYDKYKRIRGKDVCCVAGQPLKLVAENSYSLSAIALAAARKQFTGSAKCLPVAAGRQVGSVLRGRGSGRREDTCGGPPWMTGP
jgi:hypothetical protein